MLLHTINNYLCVNFSAPGRNSENHHSATLLKDAATGAPDASRRNDEGGTMNDE
jgi:hypothetical protein